MGAVEIQKEHERNIKKFCHHCICKTCLIAEVNGGAPGCGDCYKCQNEGYKLFRQSCWDYYNCDSTKGMTLDYLYRKGVESGNIKEYKYGEELVLSKEEIEKLAEELTKSIKEYREELFGGSNENNN